MGTFARGVEMAAWGLPHGDLASRGSTTARMNATVNAAFETLVDYHVWEEDAQESLYVMCNK